MNTTRRNRTALVLMLAPYIVGTLFLTGAPALLALLTSFFRTDLLSDATWVGLDNYQFLLNYPAFQYAVRNTVSFLALAVPVRIVVMLIVSLSLNALRRGIRFYRVAVYLPLLIPDVSYAIIWSWVFNPYFGPINAVLAALGIQGPLWIADRTTVWFVLLTMTFFQTGEGLVVFLAGLQQVPEELYAASSVDGAGPLQRFRFITLPLMRPWLLLMTFRDVTFGAQAVFIPALAIFGGDRYFTTWYLPQMVFEEAFTRVRFGVASSVVVVWIAIGAILFFAASRLLRDGDFVEAF